MINLIFSLRNIGLVVLVLAVSSSHVFGQEVQWRCQTDLRADSKQFAVFSNFSEKVKSRTDQNVSISFYPMGTVVSGNAVAEGLRREAIDCFAGRMNKLDPDNRAIGVLGAVGASFSDSADVNEWFYANGGNELARDAFEEIDLYYLGPLLASQWVLAASQPVNSLADIRGLDLSVVDNPMRYVVESLGANPIPQAFTELPNTGMASNGVQPAEDWQIPLGLGMYEIPKYGVKLGKGDFAGAGLAVAMKAWTSLPKNYENALSESMRELSEEMAGVVEEEEKSRAYANNFNLTQLSGSEQSKLNSAVNLGWTAYVSDNPQAEAMWNAMLTASAFEEAVQARRSATPEIVRPMVWNSWFTEDGILAPTKELKSNRAYNLNIDLSPYHYQRWQSGVFTVETERELQDNLVLRQSQGRSTELVLRVVGLGVTMSGKNMGIIDVDVDKFLRASTAEENELFDQFKGNKLGVMEFSAKVQGGTISFPFNSQNEGCAAIAISIWSADGRVPLDHITAKFPVGTVSNCTSPDNSSSFKFSSGLVNFLTSAELPERADAALHIFEVDDLGSEASSIAIFVVAGSEETTSDSSLESLEAYSWVMATSISTFMKDHLHRYLEDARTKTREEKSAPYSNVAGKLHEQLFKVKYADVDQEDADQAFAALKRLVQNKDSRQPTIFQRVTSSIAGVQHYLPLGLLSAEGAGLLDKRINVVQPLQIERYSDGDSCIDPWTLVIPEKLHSVVNTHLSEMPEIPEDSNLTRIKTIENVAKYLDDNSSDGGNANRGQGLLVLSHHKAGKIWFENGANDVGLTGIVRRFPAGSAAILAACQTVDPIGSANNATLEGLSVSNIELVVGSPFDISMKYGTRLAVETSNVIFDHIKSTSERVLLTDVFRQAAIRTVESLEGRWVDADLEFMFLGNHMIELCGASD